MSTFVPPERGNRGMRAPQRGQDDHLTREEEAFIKRYLARPESFPQEFWSAVVQKVALDGEPIPQSQIQGLSQNFAKIQDSGNTTVDITSTNASKSLLDAATHSATTGWTIGAGVMGSNRMLRLTILGDALYGNLDADTCTIGTYVGGVLLDSQSSMFTTGVPSASRETWSVTVEVINTSTTGQIARMILANSARSYNVSSVGTTLGTADTTQPWQLDVTAQWSTSTANLSLRNLAWVMELI